jgi:hypothetical protein
LSQSSILTNFGAIVLLLSILASQVGSAIRYLSDFTITRKILLAELTEIFAASLEALVLIEASAGRGEQDDFGLMGGS